MGYAPVGSSVAIGDAPGNRFITMMPFWYTKVVSEGEN